MIEAAVLGKDQDLSLGQYLQEWLAHMRGRVRATTYRGYETFIRCYALPGLAVAATTAQPSCRVESSEESMTKDRTMPSRRQLMGGILAATLVLGACDPGPDVTVIGVARANAGAGVSIIYQLCPGELVMRVQVVRAPDGIIGDDNVIWEIDSRVGGRMRPFTVDIVPDGFSETVPLEATLGDKDELAAIVDTSLRVSPYVTFTVGELRTDEAFTDGEYRPLSQFISSGPDNC